MPKDEFDFDDPLELNGVAFMTEEDTSREMTECFAEEFLRLGYNHKQVFALFRNPTYIGPNMVLQNKGEEFVKEIIAEAFARWGRTVTWCATAESSPPNPSPSATQPPEPATTANDSPLTDPLGCPAPNLNL